MESLRAADREEREQRGRILSYFRKQEEEINRKRQNNRYVAQRHMKKYQRSGTSSACKLKSEWART